MDRILDLLLRQNFVHPEIIRRMVNYLEQAMESKNEDIKLEAVSTKKMLENLYELEQKSKEEILAICGYYLLAEALEKLALIEEKRELDWKLNKALGVPDDGEDLG